MSEQKITENKYNRGKMYKIVSFQTDKCYVGSTCEQYLSNRLAGHRRNYKNHQNGKYHYVTSFDILKYDDACIVLIEDYPCENKYQLHSRERYWIEQSNCVNKIHPTRTHKEWSKTEKGKMSRKTEKAKEYQKTYMKEYSKTDKAKEYHKAYKREYSKTDKAKVYKKEYRTKRATCECGSEFRKDDMARHNRSIKHQNYLQQIQDNQPIEINQ